MFTEDQVKGSINTVDRQLLWDIRAELRRLNDNIEQINEQSKEPPKNKGGRPRKVEQ